MDGGARKKTLLRRLLVGAGILLVGGAGLHLLERCGGGADTAGAGQYEAVSERAEGIAGEVRQGIAEAQEGVRRAGGEVAAGIGEVGDIRRAADTIDREISRTGDVIADIEAGIQRIERTLQEAQDRGDPVADGCGSAGGCPGRGDGLGSP